MDPPATKRSREREREREREIYAITYTVRECSSRNKRWEKVTIRKQSSLFTSIVRGGGDYMEHKKELYKSDLMISFSTLHNTINYHWRDERFLFFFSYGVDEMDFSSFFNLL